jgi:hypothetical protein
VNFTPALGLLAENSEPLGHFRHSESLPLAIGLDVLAVDDELADGLYPLQLRHGALVHDVTGVQRTGGLEEQEPAFFLGHWTVLDAAGNDDEFAFLDPLVMVAEFHAEAPFDDKEKLVLMVMMMEDEFAFNLVELHHLAVELGADVGLPVFGDFGEFFGDIDFAHGRGMARAQEKSQENLCSPGAFVRPARERLARSGKPSGH